MNSLSRRLLAAALLFLAGCSAGAAPGTSLRPEPIRNVILLIADGAGIGTWTTGALADTEMAVQSMPVVGLVDTRSANSRVTDSAAGATAFATGQRVTNRTLSVGPPSACPVLSRSDAVLHVEGCEPIPTWFEMARDKGRATGIVTTAAVVDATPAAFVAHSTSRYVSEAIADQFEAFGLDVLLGGGRQHFEAETRSDSVGLLDRMCDVSTCVWDSASMAEYAGDDRPLVGLFAPEDMDQLESRPVRIPSMVRAALARLSRDPSGFVAVIESEATDNWTHDNAPFERVQADILEFDEAIGLALEFARRTPGTLVLATSDHETGGLSLLEADPGVEIAYVTRGHTAALVPIFAYGPGSERFAGWHQNHEIGQLLFDIVSGW